MSEAILGAILILVTAGLAEEAPPKYRKWLWGLFVVLVLAQAVLQIRSRNIERRANDELTKTITETKTKLDSSLLEQARMSGHLQAIQVVMENFSKSGIPGLQEFSSAMSTLIVSAQRHDSEPPSTAATCTKSRDLAAKIRDFEGKYEANERLWMEQQYQQASAMDREGKSKDEQRAVWRQNTIDQINWQQEHTKQFHAKYMVMAKYYKDLLLDRLSASQREFLIGKNSQADMNLDSQELAGGFNEYGIAAYLDQLATYACPSQAPSDSKSGH